MAATPTLYLESSIVSYLAAHPSRDLIVAAHQQVTKEWWDQARERFVVYTSEAVVDEITAGDPDAAARRVSFITGIPSLALTNEVKVLARAYQEKLGLPSKAFLDSVHLAYAVAYQMDYLLTWNCAHLANGIVISRLQIINRAEGRNTPVIVTPEELLELPEGDYDVERSDR
ncbi:MAG: type II toxin-antitoxin system VapC family toxin [Armatimonadetes bacterium]|nr:type II toxin-antitoxin system VapC family toxin [Armatimonadota bacterium]